MVEQCIHMLVTPAERAEGAEGGGAKLTLTGGSGKRIFEKISAGLTLNSPKSMLVYLRVLRVLVADMQAHVDLAVQSNVVEQLTVILSKPKSVTKVAGDETLVVGLEAYSLILSQSADACVIVGEDKTAAAENMVKGLNFLLERGAASVSVSNPIDAENPLEMSMPVCAARGLAAIAEAWEKFGQPKGGADGESKEEPAKGNASPKRPPTSSRKGKGATPKAADTPKNSAKITEMLKQTSRLVLSGFDLSLDMVAQPDLDVKLASALTRVIKAVTNLPSGLETVMGAMMDVVTARSIAPGTAGGTARSAAAQGTARSTAGSEALNTNRDGGGLSGPTGLSNDGLVLTNEDTLVEETLVKGMIQLLSSEKTQAEVLIGVVDTLSCIDRKSVV